MSELDVEKLPRRVAHATYALLFCNEPAQGPRTASEIIYWDAEAMSVRGTAAALREASKFGLCFNVRGLWVPTNLAYDYKSDFENRYLRETEEL